VCRHLTSSSVSDGFHGSRIFSERTNPSQGYVGFVWHRLNATSTIARGAIIKWASCWRKCRIHHCGIALSRQRSRLHQFLDLGDVCSPGNMGRRCCIARRAVAATVVVWNAGLESPIHDAAKTLSWAYLMSAAAVPWRTPTVRVEAKFTSCAL
jgi:hypothetical protein